MRINREDMTRTVACVGPIPWIGFSIYFGNPVATGFFTVLECFVLDCVYNEKRGEDPYYARPFLKLASKIKGTHYNPKYRN